MPLQETSGNATTDAYGGGVAAVPNYIESVFSTYLYTGNGNTNAQTITNNIDLSGKGGMVWIKSRSAAYAPTATDTARGAGNQLNQNTTDPNSPTGAYGISFNNNGFNIGTSGTGSSNGQNFLDATFVSWTFRKQPKFFDIVTWTGNGASSRTFTHNLKAYPNCAIIKRTDSTSDWWVWHAYASNYLQLNSTAAANSTGVYSGGSPTDFTIWDTFGVSANVNGGTYVAYLFADNAGGFGLTGTDNVISCGSVTTDATTGNATVNLKFEPQWILTKMADGLSDWTVYDNMRGMSLTNSYELFPNSSSSEVNYGSPDIFPSSTGFSISYVSGSGQYGKNKNIIYIAIRRGPMKVPTSGTSVFAPVAQNASTNSIVTTNFPTDLVISAQRSKINNSATEVFDRLRGSNRSLETNLTSLETSYASYGLQFTKSNTSYTDTFWNNGIGATDGIIYWNMRRAPSFFDEVCYTGTGNPGQQLDHNLAAPPELVIIKSRSNASGWPVYGTNVSGTKIRLLGLNTDNAAGLLTSGWYTSTSTYWTNNNEAWASGVTFVAYLFASCPGVSKVTSFTGNGSTQTINCGFTSGARFVLIKATSTTGNWLTFDTARGMTTSTDPWLALNSTAAESATTGACTTTSVGFTVDESKLTGVNTNGVSYIVLAVA